jgi:hypothetical protein
MAKDTREEFMARYLLDNLSQAERDKFESQYFADHDLFERLVELENGMIDAYVAGQLSAMQRDEFESRFLNTPDRQQRVAFARSLNAATTVVAAPAEPRAPRKPSFFKAILSRLRVSYVPVFSASLALALGLAWFAYRALRIRDLRHENPTITAGKSGKNPSMIPSQASEPTGPSASAASVFTLSAGLTRGGSSQNVIAIGSGVSSLRLDLIVTSSKYSGYSVSIESAGGRKVWHKRHLSEQSSLHARVVAVELPASLLAAGDYILLLRGEAGNRLTDELEDYSFRVTKP